MLHICSSLSKPCNQLNEFAHVLSRVSKTGAPKKAKKEKKKNSMELFRENQMIYNKFMSRKVPKIMKALGISDSDSESE